MCENPITRIHKGLPDGYVLQRGPGPEYRWFAVRVAPTEYCLPDLERPGTYLSFATVAEGVAWFAAQGVEGSHEREVETPVITAVAAAAAVT